MIKRISIVSFILLVLFLIAYNLQNYLTTKTLSFSLLSIYLFHTVAAMLVYVIVEIVAEKLPNQAGYAYLTLMFFKIGAFVLIFQSSVFVNDNLSQMERIGLVIPLVLFLIVEAIVVSKLLNSK
ncbi:DUF6168 family protein [Algibacter pacificus]|uniref:DUF6168 family protein n=1 Tax=Algibacter pacificus TaxID=2599389 RepID=UPI0011CB2A13|nr:DUF6168 family protein [Algibacter pacificus]